MSSNLGQIWQMTINLAALESSNQMTNGHVNANLISVPTISTKTSFSKIDIVVK